MAKAPAIEGTAVGELLRNHLKSMDRRRWEMALVVLLCVLGVLARLAPVAANRFHQDEAIYSHWALQVADGRDPWLRESPIDKPPLFIYLLASSFSLFGATETTARLPGELASAAALPLVYLLARRLYDSSPVALAALALFAASPFAILFAPTAFTDPVMATLVLAALWVAARRRWCWAGVVLGLAIATKPQAALFLPLALAVGCFAPHPGRLTWRRAVPAFVLGLALTIAPALAWDVVRGAPRGFIEQSLVSYGGLHWARPGEWPERAMQWRGLLAYVTGAPILDWVFVVGLPVLLATGLARGIRGPARLDWMLALFSSLFLAAHVALGVNIWDRYLLPLMPCLLLLLARVLTLPLRLLAEIRPMRAACGVGVAVLLAVTIVRPAQDAAAARLPIGGDRGAYDGLDQLATYFRGHVPGNAVVYHNRLGWHYSFYLRGFPYQFHWYTTGQELAADAAERAGSPRYVAIPSWESTTEVQWRLTQRGLKLLPAYETYRDNGTRSFTLYRIEEGAP